MEDIKLFLTLMEELKKDYNLSVTELSELFFVKFIMKDEPHFNYLIEQIKKK